ncbi:Chitinase 1 [Mortierella sp. GBA30]|nr:Chitinase 1 [Mortierella sp. GBA30]
MTPIFIFLNGLFSAVVLARSTLAFDPLSRSNVVNYWGQNSVARSGGSEADLIDYCQDGAISVFALAFINQINNGQPLLNLAKHCDQVFPSTSLLNCPKIGSDIKACQAKGKAVVVSIGGVSGSYSLPDAKAGQDFADRIWDLFLGGSSSTRPFGDAVLDGVDLDLESGQNAGYVAFIESLRAKFASPGSRPFYITAAPQCPYPDQATMDALATSWFDLVWVQFYNNYCGVHNFNSGLFNFDTWNNWAMNTSKNKNVRILLGVPGGPAAAGSGVIDASELNRILGLIQKYSNFGGVMMWDAGVAFKSGLASSAAQFLRGSTSMLKNPEPELPHEPNKTRIDPPAITAPSIPIPIISPPVAVARRIEEPPSSPQPRVMSTTTVTITEAVPTMRLSVPRGNSHASERRESLMIMVRLQHASEPKALMSSPVTGLDFIIEASCQK